MIPLKDFKTCLISQLVLTAKGKYEKSTELLGKNNASVLQRCD